MRQHYQRQLLSTLRNGFSFTWILFFSSIISIQNISVTHTGHASSRTTCSCGCQDNGGECMGDCCSTQSVSKCNCSEPHETVVTFVMPGSLDLFLQISGYWENVSTPPEGFQQRDYSYYESYILEPPSPIPIT